MLIKTVRHWGVLALPLLACACGGDEAGSSAVPWSEQRTRIIDADGEAIEVVPVSGTACVDHQGECLKPQEKCGGGGVDIIVDEAGSLVDFVCYPEEATLTVEEIEARQGNVVQNQNGAVIVLDGADDGVDIDGDLSIDANNVVIYGEQADAAVVSGTLTIDGNNALVRGIRVQGDVHVPKNDLVMALCVIEGDLVITGNNATLVACDVFGDVTVTGNNVRLSGNRIAGTLSVSGTGAVCTANRAVVDANDDRVVGSDELGAALACESLQSTQP